MVKVTIKWFARFRKRTGKSSDVLDVPEGSTVTELAQRLEGLYPGIQVREKSMGVAVNRKYVGYGHKLSDGDEVAFIPPVGGG